MSKEGDATDWFNGEGIDSVTYLSTRKMTSVEALQERYDLYADLKRCVSEFLFGYFFQSLAGRLGRLSNQPISPAESHEPANKVFHGRA